MALSTDISADGQAILLAESGEGGGPGYSAYLRKLDGSPTVRLGEGATASFSPDRRWAISIVRPTTEAQVVILPTGVGEPKPLPADNLRVLDADWLPDDRRLHLNATEPGRGPRLFIRDITGGKPRALTPEGYQLLRGTVPPDSKFVAVSGPDRRLYLYRLEGGEPTALAGLDASDLPVTLTGGGRFLFVHRRGELPLKVYRYEVASGRKELWRELMPADAAGLNTISRVVNSSNRILSDLFLADGIR